MAIIWLGSPWTGASLNPARSAGPAIASADVGDLWNYLAGPSAAAVAVGMAWRAARIGLCNAGLPLGRSPDFSLPRRRLMAAIFRVPMSGIAQEARGRMPVARAWV